jgi:hypothetical protein
VTGLEVVVCSFGPFGQKQWYGCGFLCGGVVPGGVKPSQKGLE